MFMFVFHRHASDQAYNGYKAYIQHKLLQCIVPEPSLPRSYPPCLLEWKAAKKHALMAVEAAFPDGNARFIPNVKITVFLTFKNGLNAVLWCCSHMK